ncbi:unnamed protein product [Lymnaea stagnalis]|uniref:EGF-like domain-containing protein n=1 Tax=Lymnaea stagnalis TaxID=6523 RepID=A0AAV2HT25_LYMST
MTSSRHFALLILGCLGTQLGAQKECEQLHYGADCQNICHCKGSCGVDGSCVGGCSSGWFGPQCRYDDLSIKSVTEEPRDFTLVDGDDTTCVNHTDQKIGIRVIFDKPIAVVWMTISLKSQVSPESVDKLNIQFRSVQQREWERISCMNKSVVLEPTAVHIVCQKVLECTDVFLQWDDMWVTCSISISQECYPGFYGPKCVSQCSDVCLGKVCDDKDGHCVNCPSGHTGPRCEKECEPTYYGINCQSRCSHNCLNQFCSRTTGHCVACPLGRTGHTCEQETLTGLFNDPYSNDSNVNKTHQFNTASADGSTVALIVAAVVACVVLAVVAVVIYILRDRLCRSCLGPSYPKYRVFTTSETDFSPDGNDDTAVIIS